MWLVSQARQEARLDLDHYLHRRPGQETPSSAVYAWSSRGSLLTPPSASVATSGTTPRPLAASYIANGASPVLSDAKAALARFDKAHPHLAPGSSRSQGAQPPLGLPAGLGSRFQHRRAVPMSPAPGSTRRRSLPSPAPQIGTPTTSSLGSSQGRGGWEDAVVAGRNGASGRTPAAGGSDREFIAYLEWFQAGGEGAPPSASPGVASRVGGGTPAGTAGELFDAIDRNQDGVIDRQEFTLAMEATPVEPEAQSTSRPSRGLALSVEADKDFLQYLEAFQNETEGLIEKHLSRGASRG